MTNIKYLKKNNLFEAHQHFLKLSEAYVPSFPEEDMNEADDEQGMEDQAQLGGDAQQAQGMGDPSMGMDDSQGQMGGVMMPQDGGDAMQGAPQDGMGDPMQDQGVDSSLPPSQEEPMDTDSMGDDGEKDDGDTIDINGLTKAQDKLNIKQNHVGRDLSKVDTKIKDLIDTIQSLRDKLDANNSEIESLKSEFEKRNPTQTEKLNLRSLDSYPFNVKPSDYWAEKAKQGGYEAYGDNDEPTSKEYVITNDDVDNPSRDVADTFFKIDDDDIQTLDKLFKL